MTMQSNKFGFTTMKKMSVNIYSTDKTDWQNIIETSPEFKACLSCGACAAACPINHKGTKLSIRRTIIELNRGIDISSQITDCQMCNRCSLVCPKGLNTRRIFFELLRKK